MGEPEELVVNPEFYPQDPALQVELPGQTTPQAPQFLLSLNKKALKGCMNHVSNQKKIFGGGEKG